MTHSLIGTTEHCTPMRADRDAVNILGGNTCITGPMMQVLDKLPIYIYFFSASASTIYYCIDITQKNMAIPLSTTVCHKIWIRIQ